MVQVYLVRHGETEENVAHILQGHLPGHLTANGLQQAMQLRDALGHVHFDALLSSPLDRAVRTARIVNEPHARPIVTTPLLCERDWGSLTGTIVPKGGIAEMPADVETVEAMFARARTFLRLLIENHDGKTVLVVAHGLFNRVIQAALKHLTIRDIPPMGNAEVRCLQIDGWCETTASAGQSSAVDIVSDR